MTSSPNRRRLWLLAAVMVVGACDCENQIRKLVSNSGDRRVAANDKGQKPGGPAETEPNDDPASASTFALGNELRQIRGVIGTADDVDWYAFTSPTEGAFQLVIEPETSLDISVHLEVEGGAALSYDEGRRGGVERVNTLKLGPKAQRLVIRPQSGSSGTYTLNFKRQLAGEGLEGEPNDDTSVATPFTFPGEVQATYDRPDDRDVYRLTGDPGKPFDLEIGTIAGGRHIARVFEDPQLTTPQLTVQVVDSSIHIPNLVLDAEVPRWLVLTPLAAPSSDAVYRLKAIPHPKIDGLLEAEPNDVNAQTVPFSAADERGARSAVVAGYLHTADDRDRYEFLKPDAIPRTTPIPQERDSPDYLAAHRAKLRPQIPVSARLTWNDEQSSFGMRWKGADGTEVEFRQMSPTLEVLACGLNLDAGPAVLEVRTERLGGAPSVGNPQYTVTAVESSAGESFEAEPNDTREAADVLETARRGAFAVPDDADIYAFAVQTEGDASQKVRVEAVARGVDLVLKIVDDGGGVIANVDNAALGSAEFVEFDLPGGLYFAEVRWKGGDLCAPYSIELSR